MNTSEVTINTNPFPGLRPFREEEKHLFFGRERQVETMVNKLAATRFLAVVGASGSGKSSLVNCGLRPALDEGVQRQQHGVGRGAVDGEPAPVDAPNAQRLVQCERMAGGALFRFRCAHPYVVAQLVCNLFQHPQSRRMDAVIIGHQDPRPAGAEGMAQSYGAAVDVHPGHVHAQLFNDRQADYGKGLVDLEQVDVGQDERCLPQHPGNRLRRRLR